MKILILGAGGVGGYFGARLIQAGADVTYLLRDKRHAKIQAEGLVIETPKDTFTVQPKAITRDQLKPEYDLIVLAPKSFDFEDALASLEGASAKGVFLPFLNGLDHIQQLDAKFGKDRVMGGVAQIAATISPTGAVKQLTDLHMLTVGHRSAAHEHIAREFYALCENAGFDRLYSDDIEQSLWDKWVFLASLAGMTTLCRGHVGKISAAPWGVESTTSFYAESCAIAAANGFPTKDSAQKRSLDMLTNVKSSFAASMLRDLTQGNMTEHEHILGQMIQRGVSKGVVCPLLKLAHTHLVVEQDKSK
ncbi:MAG: 2-dehydropantoate 2-reductase [Alcaligenaceae bacterium]